MTLSYNEMDSPVGKLDWSRTRAALVAVLWEKEQPKRVRLGEHKFQSGPSGAERN